jgi:hypothetical protein
VTDAFLHRFLAQRAAGGFMVQSGETKGRTAEIRSEYNATIGCTHSQRLRCYRDQAILESNVKVRTTMARYIGA